MCFQFKNLAKIPNLLLTTGAPSPTVGLPSRSYLKESLHAVMRETEGETPRQIFVDAHKVPDGEIGKTYIPAALASPHSL
jgi:hypothetical protein